MTGNKFIHRYLPTFLAVTLLVAAGMVSLPAKTEAAFTYYRLMTIAHGQVPNTDQSNFTVLVCANGASPCNTSIAGLNQSGAGAHVQNSSGYDIVFSTTDNTCATNVMNWDLEKYVASTGEVIAWVKLTSVSHTADTTFYMCYGNSGISTFQGGAAGTAWDTNYVSLYHLPDGSSLSVSDALGLNNGANGGATATTGQIDGGASFDGSSKNVNINHPSSFNFGSGDFSFDLWLNTTNVSSGEMVIGKDTDTGRQFLMSMNEGGGGSVRMAILPNNFSGFVYYDTPGSSVSSGTWTHVVGQRHGNAFEVYINGVSKTMSLGSGSSSFPVTMQSTATDAYLGFRSYPGNSNYFTGSMDEVRIASRAQTSDWINTEYNNESSPGTFETFGAENTFSSGAAPVHRVMIIGFYLQQLIA